MSVGGSCQVCEVWSGVSTVDMGRSRHKD